MFLIFAEHTNGQMSFIGTAETESQMRIIGEAIVQSPNWRDVVFLPTNAASIYEAAKIWTMDYWLNNPQLERKSEDDPLILAAMLGAEGKPNNG